MKAWLRNLLVSSAKWLGYVPPVNTQYIGPTVDAAILDTAKRWVLKYGEDRSTTGEYKRHQVYSRLLKTFPDAPHYHLAMAIELVIWKQREMV